MATLDQSRDGVGADVAGPTGDQNAHTRAPLAEPEHALAGRSAQAAADRTTSPFHHPLAGRMIASATASATLGVGAGARQGRT
jgi:hypothetical protein